MALDPRDLSHRLTPAARGPFLLHCGVRETEGKGRMFYGEALDVRPDAQDVVLKIVEKKN